MKALFKAIMILSKLLSGTAGISFLEYIKTKNALGLFLYKKSILIISAEKKNHADNHSKYHFASSASSVTLGGFSLHHFSHASASEALNSFLLISFREIFHPNEVLNAI